MGELRDEGVRLGRGKRIASGTAGELESVLCFRRIRFGRDLQRSEAIDVDSASFKSRVPAPFLLRQFEIGALGAVMQALGVRGQPARTAAGRTTAERERAAVDEEHFIDVGCFDDTRAAARALGSVSSGRGGMKVQIATPGA